MPQTSTPLDPPFVPPSVLQPIYYPPLQLQPRIRSPPFEIVLPIRKRARIAQEIAPLVRGAPLEVRADNGQGRGTGGTRWDAIVIEDDEGVDAEVHQENESESESEEYREERREWQGLRREGIKCKWAGCDAVLGSLNLASNVSL